MTGRDAPNTVDNTWLYNRTIENAYHLARAPILYDSAVFILSLDTAEDISRYTDEVFVLNSSTNLWAITTLVQPIVKKVLLSAGLLLAKYSTIPLVVRCCYVLIPVTTIRVRENDIG